jgi:hypothetical protein
MPAAADQLSGRFAPRREPAGSDEKRMTVLLVEWAFTISALLVLALAGAFVLAPFREGRRFVLLLAPMCGLLVLPIVTILAYTFGWTSFPAAAIGAMLIMSALSIATSIRWRPSREDTCWSLLLVTVLSALAAALSSASSIRNGSPSLLFIDGSDHAGYAHGSDWLLSHGVHERPILSPDVPYASWPHLLFSSDSRLSSFAVNALMAWVRGSSSLFAYDASCAVVLAAAVLGVACVFSRSPRTLVLLATGLLASAWFDLGRSGYFGKLAGYPATLFVLGLLLTNANRDAKVVAAVMVLTVGAATLHSPFAAALLLSVVGCAYVVAAGAIELFDKRKAGFAWAHIAIFGAAVLTALASSGMFARPAVAPLDVQFPQPWSWILPRVLEHQNPAVDVIGATSSWLMLALAITLQIALVIAAAAIRSAIALALAGGPLALLLLLYMLGQTWITYQIVGTLFPYALCGMAYLSDEPPVASKRALLVVIMTATAAFVATRVPRLWGAIDRYVWHVPDQQRYAASDFEKIAAIVGPDIIEINLREPLPAIAALVEFGRRGMNVQWSPQSWNTILAYRRWPPPTYATPAGFRLTHRSEAARDGEVVLETPQYRLWRVRAGN